MTDVRRTLPMLAGAVALLALLAFVSTASAAKYAAVKGANAPGPSTYDKVWVDKHGPKRAKTVLVLIPGTGGGSGSVAPVGRELARNVKGLQVWGVDRRTQAFEDVSGFKGSTKDAADYYLGFNYDRVTADQVPFVSEWGFKTEMNDLHRIIRKASKGGRKVILGGHSRGASSTVAYAAWDFKSGPGYTDLDGMVLIDGGLAAFGPQEFSRADAQERLDEIRGGDIFSDPLGAGIPEIGYIFAQLASRFALERPGGASVLEDNGLVKGGGLAPPFDTTNESFLGYLFDKTDSPLGASLNVRAGRISDGGDPRTWIDGENMRIRDFARAFARTKGNATEWYYPNRMILDTSAANALERTPASDLLGLRLFHAKRINIPLYAIQTDLTGGGVIRGAQTLIDSSRIKKAKLVDASRGTSHLDPVIAPPESNRFTQTVTPFLQRLAR